MKYKKNTSILYLFLGSFISQIAYAGNSDLDRISKDVSSRIDFKVSKTGLNTKNDLKKLLSKPLSEDSAVKIVLMNNQALQATLESWGVAKASFNKTRFPENPRFGVSVRFPKENERGIGKAGRAKSGDTEDAKRAC